MSEHTVLESGFADLPPVPITRIADVQCGDPAARGKLYLAPSTRGMQETGTSGSRSGSGTLWLSMSTHSIRIPSVCSLSALRRSAGRKGRCSRQKATYGLLVALLVGGAAAGVRAGSGQPGGGGGKPGAYGKGFCRGVAGSAMPLCPARASHC